MNAILRGFLGIVLLSQLSAFGAGAKELRSRGGNDLPFKLYNGYLIVVEGRIGSLSHLKFGLDTGVTHTTVDARLAKALAPAGASMNVVVFDRTAKTDWGVVPDLEFGPIQISNASVMIGDLRYLEPVATHLDAMIGLDILRTQTFTIDYRKKNASFGAPTVASEQVPMKANPTCLTVEVTVANQPTRMIVDTGLAGVVMYADRLSNGGIPFQVVSEINGISLAGRMRWKIAVMPPLHIGTRSIGREVSLAQSPGDKYLPGISGFLGTSALQAHRVQFDFANNTLSWSD